MPFCRSPYFLILFSLAACVPNLPIDQTGQLIESAGEARLQLDVPFFPRPEGLCGPAALASVLNYWHSDITPEAIADKIDLPKLNGVLPFDLTHFARSKGFHSVSFQGGLPDLKNRLSRGIPVVTFLNRGTSFFPVGHFLVVTGIDVLHKKIIVHSGRDQNKPVPFEIFMADWKGGGYWVLEVTPLEAQSKGAAS